MHKWTATRREKRNQSLSRPIYIALYYALAHRIATNWAIWDEMTALSGGAEVFESKGSYGACVLAERTLIRELGRFYCSPLWMCIVI